MVVLVPCALLFRSVSLSDIANLRGTVGDLGVVGRLLSRVLGILEEIMTILHL
jgi:hypothetical protein